MLNATYVPGGTPVEVYATRGEEMVAPDAEGSFDPAPILGEIRRVVGQDYPETWAQHLFQRRRMGSPFRSYRAVSFEHAQREGNPRQWRRDEWSRAGYCVEFSSWVRVTEAGTYRMAARGAGSVFLLWGADEEPVVEFTTPDDLVVRRSVNQPTDSSQPWRTGAELRLTPGVYPIRIVQISRQSCDATPAWIPPGADEPVEIPADQLMTGQKLLPRLRYEKIDGIVHADFADHIAPGYRFRGVEGTFALVSLNAASIDWTRDELEHWWQIGDGPRRRGSVWTLPLPQGHHAVGLTSRNSLGFESRVTRELIVSDVAVDEYRVSGALHGVPSICYDSDRIWPDVWLSGTTPTNVVLQCRLTIAQLDGRTTTSESDVVLVNTWGRLRGEEIKADDVASIGWEISHAGKVLAQQHVRFVRQPFTVLPEDSVGSELVSGGERVVLVVRRMAANVDNPPPTLARAERIVCLDSTLAPQGWYAGSNDTPFYEVLQKLLSEQLPEDGGKPVGRIDYETLSHNADGSLRSFAPLAGLQEFRRGDLVVISLGLEAYADREPPAALERRLAGLCALLLEVAGAEVVLVTPPPIGESRSDMRPYAESVLRVADAYGLGVADLYSAFGGHGRSVALFEGLRVTGEGQRLAASVLLRVLQRGY